jgi:membrane glycosyltransferase
VLFASGLHWVSRAHMAMGIMAYVSALVWLLFLVIALSLTLQSIYSVPQYFTDNFSLFPNWPMQDSARSFELLMLTLGILLLPKFFAYALAIMDSNQRRGFGGASKLFAGVLVEIVLSSLFAHIMMLLQSSAVIDVFRGGDSGWKPQRRDDGSLPTAEIMQFHSKHMVIGACLGALTLYSSYILFLWMLPATLGLLFSGPLSAWSARRSAGEKLKSLGLLQIAEEKAPPAIAGEAAEVQKTLEETVLQREAITHLAESAALRRLHRQLIQMQPISLESRISPNLAVGRAKLEISSNLTELLRLLNPGEKAALLSDPESLARLEALIPAEIPPETAHHAPLQSLEQTS